MIEICKQDQMSALTRINMFCLIATEKPEAHKFSSMCLGLQRVADLWASCWKSVTVSFTLYNICWNSIPRTACWILKKVMKDNHPPHSFYLCLQFASPKVSILISQHSSKVVLLGNSKKPCKQPQQKVLSALKVVSARPTFCGAFHRLVSFWRQSYSPGPPGVFKLCDHNAIGTPTQTWNHGNSGPAWSTERTFEMTSWQENPCPPCVAWWGEKEICWDGGTSALVFTPPLNWHVNLDESLTVSGPQLSHLKTGTEADCIPESQALHAQTVT